MMRLLWKKVKTQLLMEPKSCWRLAWGLMCQALDWQRCRAVDWQRCQALVEEG